MQHHKRLLVVDDSEAEREIIGHILEAAFPGAQVRRVANPALVPQICREDDFDCVLLDYNMPELDGLTLARALRAANAYVPIILVTSVGDEMLVAEALRGGVTDYITKSRITHESMLRTVTRSIQVCGQARLIDDQRAELENFAFALAHDFKQPIRQIITFSHLISEAIQRGETDEIASQQAFLVTAAARLGRLVDVMLDYTLLNQPPELGAVDLGEVFAAVRASLTPLLDERGGVFVTPDVYPSLYGNETLMIQTLQNLVVNALLYNRSAEPRVEVSTARRGEGWVMSVADNGVGIDAAYLGDIFKPLLRLHAAAEVPGTGLGLTLARKAVIAQKGAIWCESTPGLGSIFHIRLGAAKRQGDGLTKSWNPTAPAETAPRARTAAGPRPRRGRGEVGASNVVPGPGSDLGDDTV
jgi:signal transduction histidine kinase